MREPRDRGHSGARIAAFWAVLFLMVVVLLEVIGFASVFLTDDLFDHRAGVLARVNERELKSKQKIDPVLGWEPEAPSTFVEANCIGAEISYRIAADGARSYPGYQPSAATIVIAGDSYAFGSEVGDSQTFPAALAKLSGQTVANLGVGGYGPVQSLLRLERHIDQYPQASTVVLGIMYENVHRMVNGYRPVLYDKTEVLTFTPYMSGGQVQPHPGIEALSTEDKLQNEIIVAFDTDFWAKPQHNFPFSMSLARAFTSNYFVLRKVQKSMRKLGRPEYALSFGSPIIQDNLFGLIDRFAQLADARGLRGIVLFMPRNRLDTKSVSTLVATQGARLPTTLLALDVAEADIDWTRYNLENKADDNICHPSEYGYTEIARHLAASLP